MKILLNGDEVEVAAGSSVAQLLEQMSITTRFVAVEVNLEIVPLAQHETHLLQDGDSLEVVTMVGGG